MIKTKNGCMEVEGSVATILADIACIIHGIRAAFADAEIEDADERIREAFDIGMFDEDELEGHIEKVMAKKEELLDTKKTLEAIRDLLEKKLKGE